MRVYECQNRRCRHFGRSVVVRGTPLGQGLHGFHEVLCECGLTPPAVGALVVDATPAPAELMP